MSLLTKIRSESILPQKPLAENPGSTTTRHSNHVKRFHIPSKSPIHNKSDRQLFNSNFSHLPPGAVVMLPPRLKAQEGCIYYFAKNVMERADRSVPGKRDAYDTIKKTMDYEEVQRVVETSSRIQTNQLLANKKRGSMYLSEFWTKKQALNVIKTSELEKGYKESKVIEREGLPARLKKLENLYERRKDINGNLEMTDISKIMQDFENQGINSPLLKFHTKKPQLVRTETSILDTDEDFNPATERVKKLAPPSLLDIPSSVYDGNTNDTMTARSKCRSNVSGGSKVKSMLKFVLPKISGNLTELTESMQDIESNQNMFNSLGYSNSRIETGSSYPTTTTIEEGGNVLTEYYGESSEREKSRGKSTKILGLKTIREIALGAKVNGENKSVKNVTSERSNKSYDSNLLNLKQKLERNRLKPLEQNRQEIETSAKRKGRSYRNGRKDLWVVPRKCGDIGQL